MAVTEGCYIDSFRPETNRVLESEYSKTYEWLEEDTETNCP